MQNLEQLRAAAALKFWADDANSTANIGGDGGKVVPKLPSLIINNGLLSTTAFAKSKGQGYEKLLLEIARHIGTMDASARPVGFRQGETGLDPFLRTLAENDSSVLQRATAEALAYLSYLKRFAP
jgi:CRISPR-associated protein Cmr5